MASDTAPDTAACDQCPHPLAEHYESGCGWCICKVPGTAVEEAGRWGATVIGCEAR